MLVNLIVHAPDRPAALAALTGALAGTEVLGVRTNLPFLRAVSADPVVTKGDVTTTWLESAYQGWTSGADEAEAALALAAAAAPDGGSWQVWWRGAPYPFELGPGSRLVDAEGGVAHLGAPMPGTIIAVKVAPGQTVHRG